MCFCVDVGFCVNVDDFHMEPCMPHDLLILLIAICILYNFLFIVIFNNKLNILVIYFYTNSKQ